MKLRKLGRYELLEELGHGAMGTVYRARDPLIDRVVAIKTIQMTMQEELAEYQARFYQEARAAGKLSHPNIVTVYDIGNAGRIAFIAMEFLAGQELAALLAQGEPLPPAQAVDIAAQVACGLAYAHEHQVVHRDIKPANILIDGSRVKIADFGIARMRFSRTQTESGAIVGSPRYMSPEQVLGRRTGPQSDLFSLGVVLYEMLTGRAPFTGREVNALMFQILNVAPPVPGALNPAVPEMLNLVVAKAMAKAPADRYFDAGELAADLRQCARLFEGVSPHARIDGAFVVAQPKIDQESSALLHTGRQPGTRREDLEEHGEESAPTLGVAKAFDSLEATMRLAAQTGMTQEIEDYTRTQKLLRIGGPGERPRSAPMERAIAPYSWAVRQRLVFAAGVAGAFLAALGMVLL
jgi:serine/threonine-protein kinase